MTFLVSFLHGYLYSVKCDAVPYVLQSYFYSLMAAVKVNVEVFICLSACNYKRPHLRMYVCNYNWLIHQHCLQALVRTTVVHMCCECASLFLMCRMVRLPF